MPDFYGGLVEEVEMFGTNNIMENKNPPAQSEQVVLQKYNRHTDGKIVEVNDEVFEAYKDLKGLKDQLSELEERKTALEEKIKVAFGDAEAISYGGQTLATWKAPKPSNKFDTKAFQAAHPDLAREFTVPTQGARRFLLK